MTEIDIQSVLDYKIKNNKDYSKGGIYMIKNTKDGRIYIGKSIDYMSRIKQHLYPSSNKTLIDKELKNEVNSFKFYLIKSYKDLDINFFNRFKETIIEHQTIKEFNSYYPKGYNITYYEHLRNK